MCEQSDQFFCSMLGLTEEGRVVMGEQVQRLAPWEVPPDETYWQALLNEGEYGERAEQQQETTAEDVSDSPVEALAHEEPPTQRVREGVTNWDTFRACQTEDQTVELEVVGFNRGGLLVSWDGVTGFVPASQLCEGVSSSDEDARREVFSSLVGNTLSLKVIEVDPTQNRLILSERAARRVLVPDMSVLDDLSPGDVRQGKVTNLCSFGAFVDLGGVEGLIHISELSWGRVSHPSDVLQSGQETDVYVLNVDRARGRVGLSLKRLYPDPWDTAETKYEIGKVIEGAVTNIVNFGAFVRIEEGLEGLIHNSDWSDNVLQHAIREGDIVRVRVVSIDRERHRMGLSLEEGLEG
jgi:small subunit ribosomal protein S1